MTLHPLSRLISLKSFHSIFTIHMYCTLYFLQKEIEAKIEFKTRTLNMYCTCTQHNKQFTVHVKTSSTLENLVDFIFPFNFFLSLFILQRINLTEQLLDIKPESRFQSHNNAKECVHIKHQTSCIEYLSF